MLIGAVVLWPPQLPFMKGDFELCVGGDTLSSGEPTRRGIGRQLSTAISRAGAARSTTAELVCRDRSLGQTTLPVFGPEEFAKKLCADADRERPAGRADRGLPDVCRNAGPGTHRGVACLSAGSLVPGFKNWACASR